MSSSLRDVERVVGFEMEYSPSVKATITKCRGLAKLVLDSRPDIIEEIISNEYESIESGFLGNGFRSYIDCDLNELCTPECYPNNVGLAQLASEAIIEESIGKYIDEKFFVGGTLSYLLPLRVAQGLSSSGYHENYQVLSYYDTKGIVPFLSSYAATQMIWTGQGEYNVDTNTYSTAQKVYSALGGSWDLVASKGFINEEDRDSRNDRYEFRRQNYPLSHWQLRHRAAFTSGVIRAAELGLVHFRDITFGDPTGVYRQVADDPNTKLIAINGKKYTAAEYQLNLAEQVASIGQKAGFPDYEVAAAKEVARVCENIRAGKTQDVANEVPWIRKLQIINTKVPNALGDNVSHEDTQKALALCIACDSLGYGGLVEVIRKRQADPAYNEEAVTNAKKSPPCIKVAKLRASNIRKLHGDGNLYYTNWMSSVLTKC